MQLKVLFLTLLISSCGVFETAKEALTVPYDVGKFQGRMEIIQELERNKKKISDMKKILAAKLIDLSEEDEKQVMMLAPEMLGMLQLLENRKALKRHLINVTQASSE